MDVLCRIKEALSSKLSGLPNFSTKRGGENLYQYTFKVHVQAGKVGKKTNSYVFVEVYQVYSHPHYYIYAHKTESNIQL